MPLREDLLQPIPGPNPAGVDLRYDPLYDKIKEARREDDDAPQGEWQRARKTADWPLAIKLASDAIATKSKDLQLAAWLTEAALRKEGIGGLRQGLDLCRGLIETFWDGLYPEIDDGDAEMRAAPLEWMGLKLDVAVRMSPITKGGVDLFRYREARAIAYEADAAADDAKLQARARAIEEGKLTPEEFDKAFDATPKAWYKALAADLDTTLESLAALDTLGQARFGSVAPGYGRLRTAIEDVRHVAAQLLKTKLEKDPDPVETAAFVSAGDSAGAVVAGGDAAPAPVGAMTASADAASRDDAAARVVSAARFLRRTEPTNPASYLMLRGFRWGELRAAGDPPDPKLLDAPATPVRTQLKRLLLDGQWAQLLEAAEHVMGTPQGRGWLDLQRYALTAIDHLGAEYGHVGAAIRTELRALLADLPGLLDMTLMDDTPTANAETREWLKTVADVTAAPAGANGRERSSEGFTPAVRERALAEVRGGHPERAIELLMRELSREKTRRGRFLGQTLLADIMVDAGHEAVALPILEELLQSVETYHLEEWESGDVVAAPMSLLYRCLAKLDGDPTARHTLYLRICRLDPLRAIEFSQQSAAQVQ